MKHNRFFCPTCKEFRDRFQVVADEWNQVFFCKKCEDIVIRTGKVYNAMIKDFIEYATKNGGLDDYR